MKIVSCSLDCNLKRQCSQRTARTEVERHQPRCKAIGVLVVWLMSGFIVPSDMKIELVRPIIDVSIVLNNYDCPRVMWLLLKAFRRVIFTVADSVGRCRIQAATAPAALSLPCHVDKQLTMQNTSCTSVDPGAWRRDSDGSDDVFVVEWLQSGRQIQTVECAVRPSMQSTPQVCFV